MMHDYGGYGYMGFGFLYMLIFWGLIFYVIYWVVNSGKNANFESPEEILKKRLAKGEITKKKYNELKKEIEK